MTQNFYFLKFKHVGFLISYSTSFMFNKCGFYQCENWKVNENLLKIEGNALQIFAEYFYQFWMHYDNFKILTKFQ